MASSKYPQHPWLQTALELISENVQEEEQDEAENDSSTEEVSKDADLESVVIEQQNRLQVQDWIRTREEISGLIDVPDESDNHFVWSKLSQMKEAIDKLAACDASAAYHIAMAQFPKHVRDREFRLRFLRAESFHSKLAAKRFMNYFEFVREYFGVSALGRTIRLEDLDNASMATMRSGKFQILRVRDRASRAILCDTQVSDETLFKDSISLVKVLFYMICTMAEDPVTSRKGGVVILYYVGDFSRIPMDFEFPTLSARAQQACPLRFSAAHVCLLSTNKVARRFLSTALKLSQTKTVQHVKIHQASSDIECRHSLATAGIEVDHIPVTQSIHLKTKNHFLWIQQRIILEEGRKRGQAFEGIDLPMPLDVLGGQGKPIQEYSGNLRLKELVHSALSTYDAAPGGQGKEDVVKQIIAAVQEAGGRFLERRTSDGLWEVIAVEKAMERVRVCLRNARATNRRRRQCRQAPVPAAKWKSMW